MEEEAFYDYLDMRQAALDAAVGNLIVNNVPRERVQVIADTTTCELLRLAARVVLYVTRAS